MPGFLPSCYNTNARGKDAEKNKSMITHNSLLFIDVMCPKMAGHGWDG